MSVMHELLSGTKPLQGRAVVDLRLGAFDYRDSRAFWQIADPVAGAGLQREGAGLEVRARQGLRGKNRVLQEVAESLLRQRAKAGNPEGMAELGDLFLSKSRLPAQAVPW